MANFRKAWTLAREETVEPEAIPVTTEAEKTDLRERVLISPQEETPVKAPEEVLTEPDDFLAEARQRAKQDPEAAMLWLQEQSSGSERLRGMLEVVALWAADDSESAMLWLESNAQGLARLETLNSGVSLWAASDPSAAADWIDGMANDGSKITAAKSLASTWIQNAPNEATSWIESLPDGTLRNEAATALAESWIETDPDSAAAWAYNEANRSGNRTMLIDTIESYAGLNPEAAEAFVRNISLEDPFDLSYMSEFVKARAMNDPAGTASWLESMAKNDPYYSSSHATQLMTAWTETDSIAASTWLSDQPLGAERDAAIIGFTESIQRFEPEAATEWANTISDPDRRLAQISSSIRNWAANDPKAALEWVISAELEPALQEQLAREIGVD